ncbi:MAG: DUF2752 domain-containing protein [Porcipelethomonas sp.]
MCKRLRNVLIMLAAISAAGVIYFILSSHGISLPCVFYEITGLYCPGCGATRMCASLMKLDFYSAFRSNQVSFFVVPLIGAIMARRIFCYIKYGEAKNEKWMSISCTIALVMLVIFGVLRNLPPFDFLRPL